ncbi:MAG: hypothetical protein CSA65_04965 [Proteobacteria bacterium]|nr:MAG: hypothetical protein CSB49_05900 [Pseudomonadota bacterium]PIE18467.1 MAG: hypothetical protein CSA65_04965 [Pseudomonadota bacterium]
MNDSDVDRSSSKPPSEDVEPRPSIQRVGNYQILEEIGSGGMAVVYKGSQESLGRVVAIKALKTVLTSDPNIVARFEREAMSVASFQHENIITLYDFFRERGALFMVMEFVEGIDLYDLLERAERIPHEVAAIMALQVARALDYAHFRGVIHRDVKPANIIISRLGEVKLTDFGIARTEHSDLTEAGIGLGTPAYMSPEQIIGDHLDHRSDIWSLGIVLYQMLTGKKPFVDDEERSAMQRIRLDEAEPVKALCPDCPKELIAVIDQCMQKSPDDRYLSTQELVVELEHYVASHVHTNYRARMVFFLKEQGVISDEQTTAMLHPALIGGGYGGKARPLPRRPSGGGSQALGMLLLVLGVALGGVGGWLGYERYGPGAQAAPKPAPGVCPPADRTQQYGQLIVRVHPWANVKVDGKQLETTPLARPLMLPVGKHRVELTNPYFKTRTLEVVIRQNKAYQISETLEMKDADRGGSSPSSGSTKRAAKGAKRR